MNTIGLGNGQLILLNNGYQQGFNGFSSPSWLNQDILVNDVPDFNSARIVNAPRTIRVVPRPLAAPLVASSPVVLREDEHPKPFSFGFDSTDEMNNRMTRQEQQDESGRVTGSYTIADVDGRQRVVNYVADENGFRADVQTNEPGTIDSAPADVIIRSPEPVNTDLERVVNAPKKS